MANRERGEFTLRAGEHAYVLRLTTNAACELEDFANGRNLGNVYAGMNRNSLKDIRLFLWVALRDKHPEIATDDPACLKTIGTIIDAAGGIEGISDQLEAFMALNADTGETEDEKKQQEGAAKKAGTRPRKARAGTGGRSSPTPFVAA